MNVIATTNQGHCYEIGSYPLGVLKMDEKIYLKLQRKNWWQIKGKFTLLFFRKTKTYLHRSLTVFGVSEFRTG